MSAASCSACGGTRWVRYLSETTDGDLEEAFGLCPCNHEHKVRRGRAHEEPEPSEIKAGELASPSGRDASH